MFFCLLLNGSGCLLGGYTGVTIECLIRGGGGGVDDSPRADGMEGIRLC